MLRSSILFISIILFGFTACSSGEKGKTQTGKDAPAELPTDIDGLEIATFAGGCFWCTEAVYERVEGVKYVISGYAGGTEKFPTYKEVSYGRTSHAETIQIYYDPKVVTYKELVEMFFLGAHDPTQVDGQGPDKGKQYRSMAFYRTEKEKQIIKNQIGEIESSDLFDMPIATEVVKFDVFYPAEKYHQDYFPANPGNPYVQGVTKPKVEKFEKKYNSELKSEYKH